MLNLKSFREDRLKLTQIQFAKLIGEDLSTISNWEKTNEVPINKLEKICRCTGTDFNTLLDWKKPKPKPLVVEDKWANNDFTKHSLLKYIDDNFKNINLQDDQRETYIDDLRKGIQTSLIKPKIAIVGRSDTGKSTMINALLGVNQMPTSWTPTTSIAVYIKHKGDRPHFIHEDVWVFAASINNNESHWDEQRLYDEGYCKKWKIGAGSIDILQSYGTRQGDDYTKCAGSAVVFIDAPILNNCDIIDLPGFGTETESDDNITFSVTQNVDVIIYLSQANGFMRMEDITYLKRNISELPVWEKMGDNNLEPLCNLFIVASQAHTVNGGNKEQLTNILDNGCRRLLGTLPEHYWDNRKKVSNYSDLNYKRLRRRFFVYTTDIPDLCHPFNSSLKKINEELPNVIEKRTKSFVKEFIKKRKLNLENEMKKYEGIILERSKYVALIKEIDENESKRVLDNNERKNNIRLEIDKLKEESKAEFSNFCSSTLTEECIIELLKERKVKNKKEDVEQFGSWFQGYLQEKCELILKDNSKTLTKKTEDYIKAFSDSITTVFETNDITVDFDAGWAFVSALATFGVFGGLGGLIMGAGVFAFGSVSLILGGVGTAALYACGLGPIGLGVGLVVSAALGIVKLFGGGWQKNVAKKIIKTIEENNVVEQFRDGITHYWDETEDAFNNAAKALDEDWKKYVEDLREAVEGYDVNAIQQKMNSLSYIKSFLSNIPL